MMIMMMIHDDINVAINTPIQKGIQETKQLQSANSNISNETNVTLTIISG